MASERLPAHCAQYLEILGRHAPVEKVWSGPAYVFTREFTPPRAPIAIDATNADLLRGRFDDWMPDVRYRQPFMALIEEGRAMALCASVRISKAVHCAGVETHRDHRRRGHATAVVAGWAQAVRSLGATPFYSTSWENIASQRIAARLGFRLAAVDFSVT
jgi:RimJ/RimL family protein N-acetyltransferase